MAEPTGGPAPYKVSYSDAVKAALRRFAAEETAAGRRDAALAVLKDLEFRLRVYPQFGEPYLDLVHESGVLYRGCVPPLVVKYAIYEELRMVFVGGELAVMKRHAPRG